MLAAVTRLLFNTPCFGRYELTSLALGHRVQTIEQLAERGIEAQCVVIADDDNLDIARGLGFQTIEAKNLLGLRFNLGYEMAVKKRYTHCLPMGSDQLVSADFLAILPCLGDRVLAGRWYCSIRGDGQRCLIYRNPVYCLKCYPVSALRRCRRPIAEETIMRGCDTATHKGVFEANPGLEMSFFELDGSGLEYVQMGSGDGQQVTSWKRQVDLARLGKVRHEMVPPWPALRIRYGKVIEQVREFYSRQPAYATTRESTSARYRDRRARRP